AAREPFYNRENEVSTLVSYLQRTPTSALVLTGPPDCGKTALLREVAARATALGPQPPGSNQQAFLVVDMRQRDTTNPAAFAAVLGRELEAQPWWLDVKPGVEGPGPSAMPLEQLLAMLEGWMDAAPAGNPRPVLVIGCMLSAAPSWPTKPSRFGD
ncbi:hypothetical protein TSOC_014151, partial [Tetrabaena socialis]